jgi:hypothetical protein
MAMRRATILLTALPLLGLPLSATATPAQAAQGAASAACRAPVVAPHDVTSGQSLLRNVRVGRHDDEGFDRVVFDLTRVPGYRVQYVRQVIQDGSGQPLSLHGRAFLTVRLEPAAAHTEQGEATAPRRIRPGFTSLKEVRSAGDFEGVVSYGLGIAARGDFRVFRLSSPSRLVVDVAFPNRHPFDCRSGVVKVYFADVDANASAVTRRVPVPAVGRGALTALFAGPTGGEYARGLRLVTSGATGFTGLSIRDGIARVRLTRGCNSHGSTFTVANEIVPTLKQFPTVRHVKIFDPQGRTEQPTGRADSIPECLEP